MSFKLIKMTHVKVRKRPALFSSPKWQEKTEDGQTLPATERWRDQRKQYDMWEVGIWINDYNPTEEIVGLLHHGHPTHHAFYLRDLLADKASLLAGKGIYFDAGTSCSELYVEPEEWQRVLEELDFMSRYLTLLGKAQQNNSSEKERNQEPVLQKPLAP